MNTTEINLLKLDASSAHPFSDIEAKLRLVAWWSLVGLLVLGIIIGTMFFFFNARSDQLTTQNTKLRQQIDSQLVKEGILVSLKDRSDVARKALDAARPWGNLFPILVQIAQPTQMSTLTVDDTARVSITLKLSSVDDAVAIVSNVIALTGNNAVRSPQLTSFAMESNGFVQMGLSFIPVLL